jgi:tetratricopeptide (TPR) repeat protein
MPLLSALVVALFLGQAPPTATAPAQTPRVDADVLAQAYALYVEGQVQEDAGNADAAMRAYRRAAELVPHAAEVRAALSLLFAQRGELDESLKEAAAAIALEPDNRTARRTRGLVRANMAATTQDRGRAIPLATDAVEDLERALADRLPDLQVGLALGRMYVLVGQHAKAIERLRAFLQDRPGWPDALLLLADAYEGTRDVPAAIAALEEVAAARPDTRLSVRLAGLHERAGQWREAADTWGRLAERNPRALAYRNNQASALVSAGNLAAARDVAAGMTVAGPNEIAAWYLLSQIELRLGNAARAEAAAVQIAGIDAEDPRGLLALASAKAARKDHRGVVTLLEPRVRAPRAEDATTGSLAQMASRLASSLAEIGDHKRAIALLEDVRRRDDRNVDLLFTLGAAYERAKRYDDAERTFRGVIAVEPDNADALNYLGYMLADRKLKLVEAVDLISRALKIDADNPSFLDSLGWAYVQQANLTAARDPLQRAAAALPTTSVIQDHLAELYFRLQMYAEAAATWDRALAGDREGVDVGDLTKKRNRAKGLSERSK